MNLPPERLKRVMVAATLTLLPLLYFYPALTEQVQLMPGDGWTQNLGVRVLTGRLIAQGILPLWNPYIFAGMPLLASVYPGALYPPNWLFAVFSPGVAMNLVVVTTFHLALIGSYLYARRVGMSRLGALVAGIIFSFGGYMVAHISHTSRIAAAAWLPWVLLAIESLYQQARWQWVMLGALFIALQLFAGEPQMTAYTALVGGAYALFSLTLREEREPRWRLATAAVVMAICGALLSAIQLLPQWELLQQGERAQLNYGYFASYSLPPRQLFALIFPYFFGGASRPPFTQPYWGEWNVNVVCGYVGLLGGLLGLIAVFSSPRSRLIWFWAGVACLALLLACGDYLPFQLNHLLYRVPFYNLFRGSYRHLFEFTFAVAALAGLGLSAVARMERTEAQRALARSVAALAVIVAGALIAYRFFGEKLAGATARPTPASLVSADVIVPLCFFILSVIALWVYTRRRTRLTAAWLLLILLTDLAAFGHFFEWRTTAFDVEARLADPPSVQYIKAREPDLSGLRIASHASLFYDYGYTDLRQSNYELLDRPNVSIARGLQSVNGYDVLRLRRLAALTGEIDFGGLILDVSAFDRFHQGLNLLNVKYLLLERRREYQLPNNPGAEGAQFSKTTLNLSLGQQARMQPGTHLEISVPEVEATELALVTTMTGAVQMPDGMPVVGVKLHTKDGRVIERELQAGRDTAEWAYDRADLRPAIRHQRARIFQSEEQAGFQSHTYLARLAFERAEIARIELDYLRPEADLYLVHGSLYHAATGLSTPLDGLRLPPERWRKLESFGQVEIYENLKLLPRAWFVRRVEARPSAEVLRAIKEGRLDETAAFEPAETALLETEDFNASALTLPSLGDSVGAEVKVTRYEAQRIELETRHSQPGFLVLGEVHYPGWEARIDGAQTPVYRADYALRGVAVPAGDHRIEFVFRAPTFRAGAACSGLAMMVLLLGAVVTQRRKAREPFKP